MLCMDIVYKCEKLWTPPVAITHYTLDTSFVKRILEETTSHRVKQKIPI